MNFIVVIGNLTRDPERNSTRSGKDVCDFTVAINRFGKDEPLYVKVVTWGNTAKNCAEYLTKGSSVAVIGDIDLDKYTKKDGTTDTKIVINASSVKFLSRKNEAMKAQAEQAMQNDLDFSGLDIPF